MNTKFFRPRLRPRLRMVRGMWVCGIGYMDSYTARTPQLAYEGWLYNRWRPW